MTALLGMGSVRRLAPAASRPGRRRTGGRHWFLLPAPATGVGPPKAERLEPRRLLSAFTVTSEADAGPGTLRQAILDANAAPGADTISFALSGAAGAVQTIRPMSPLPAVTDTAALDATTQPGYAGTPLVELDGSLAGADADGLTVLGASSSVAGIAVNRFSRNGVVLRPAGVVQGQRTVLRASRIGTDVSGQTALPNGAAGVVVAGSGVLVTGNLISGNSGAGLSIQNGNGLRLLSPDVAVEANRIGTDASGTRAFGNGAEGVLVNTDMTVAIGSTSARIPSNLISGNGASGIRTFSDASTYSLQVVGNLIGTDAAGNAAVGNGSDPAAPHRDGITVDGRTLLDFRVDSNLISGNAGAGVSLLDSSHGGEHAVLFANRIGMNSAATAPLGNGGDGVTADGVEHLELHANVIGGNGGDGVNVTGTGRASSELLIEANRIGLNWTGEAFGNAGNGIELTNVAAGDIGGPNWLPDDLGHPLSFFPPIPPGTYQNIIGANGGHGILVSGGGSAATPSTLHLVGNRIGIAKPGSGLGTGNGGSGIYLAGVFGTIVGAMDDQARNGNIIGRNGGDGITVTSLGSAPSSNIQIGQNWIGAGVFGAAAGNAGWGVALSGTSRNVVAKNTIGFNAHGGVLVAGASATGGTVPPSGNVISANSIFSNGGLGIDLGGDGVTPNDPLDADAGPNGLQNFPAITGVSSGPAGRTVQFRLDAAPQRTYTVQIFFSRAPDPRGYGEGEAFAGSALVTTDAAGVASGAVFVPVGRAPPYPYVTATAGSTSEFSRAVSVASARPVYRPVARPPATAALGSTAPPAAELLAPRRRDVPGVRGLLG